MICKAYAGLTMTDKPANGGVSDPRCLIQSFRQKYGIINLFEQRSRFKIIPLSALRSQTG